MRSGVSALLRADMPAAQDNFSEAVMLDNKYAEAHNKLSALYHTILYFRLASYFDFDFDFDYDFYFESDFDFEFDFDFSCESELALYLTFLP